MLDIFVPILLFVLILGVVIFVHELGHFLAAVRAGIFVEEFALGMGPKIFSFYGKKKSAHPRPDAEGDEYTMYSLRMLPIGGYCKMRGQDEDVPDDPEAMNNKSVFARICVIAGGSAMNFLVAFLLFFALVMLRGFPVAEVVGVRDSMPAYNAGLMVGDRITHIDGTRVSLYEDFMFMLDTSGGQELELRIRRDTGTYITNIAPVVGERGNYVIGIYRGWRLGLLDQVPADPDSPFVRVGAMEGLRTSADMIGFHMRTPFRLLARLASGQPMPEGGGVMGPIGIGGVITEVYQDAVGFGFVNMLLTMLMFTALLNAMLGVMNLLPIPALDGARLVFLFIEAIRRKPVAPEREAMVHVAGLVTLLVFAVFIAYRDIVRLIW